MRNKRGFTLIELLAVIVILAIIALITVPIILKMLNNSRRDSAIRSAENYVDGVKKAVVNNSDNEDFNPGSCDVIDDGARLRCDDGTELDVDVEGNKPASGTVYFADGSVDGVQDLKFGKWYICSDEEKLVAYTEPSSARQPFEAGEVVVYNGERFIVVNKSSSGKNYITVIRETPLSKEEVEKYGYDTKGKNHVNVNVNCGNGVGKACNDGKVAYYSSTKCYKGNTSSCQTSYSKSDIKVIIDNWANAVADKNNVAIKDTGYSIDMVADTSDYKKVNGYKMRLLSQSELKTGLGMSNGGSIGGGTGMVTYQVESYIDGYWDWRYDDWGNGYDYWVEPTYTYQTTYSYFNIDSGIDNPSFIKASYQFGTSAPQWATTNQYEYWTMSPYQDYKYKVEVVYKGAGVVAADVFDFAYVRPVLNIYKSSVSSAN